MGQPVLILPRCKPSQVWDRDSLERRSTPGSSRSNSNSSPTFLSVVPGSGTRTAVQGFVRVVHLGLISIDRSMFINDYVLAAGHQLLRLILFLRNSAALQRRRRRQECVRLLFRSNRLHSHSPCQSRRRPHPKRSPMLPRSRRTRSPQTQTMPEVKWPHSPISPRPTSMHQHPV